MVALGSYFARQRAHRERIIVNCMRAPMLHVDDIRVTNRPPPARRSPARSEPTPARPQFKRNYPVVVEMNGRPTAEFGPIRDRVRKEDGNGCHDRARERERDPTHFSLSKFADNCHNALSHPAGPDWQHEARPSHVGTSGNSVLRQLLHASQVTSSRRALVSGKQSNTLR